jgi:hypothetical protein
MFPGFVIWQDKVDSTNPSLQSGKGWRFCSFASLREITPADHP